MATEFKYWAFISYSHADKKWGTWLHSGLETFKVPKVLAGTASRSGEPIPNRIFPVFRDREELPTSSDLGSMIARALEASRTLIVICSPHAARSHWVNEEILEFKRLGRADRILALIVDGEPNASDGKPGFSAEAECFPEALRFALGADGKLDRNLPTEPIAADARPHMDGRTNAKLKLAAGVLGINYDDLKRREERRRRQRQRIVIAVSTALVVTFAGLAAMALWQRSIAKKETIEANAQRQEAEKQKAEADTQRSAAETQKGIAEKETVEAENEKEQVETRTAADEEDIAREALLRGDSLTAAQHLSLAYESEPQDRALRLLLHAAMSGLDGLSRVLQAESGSFTNVEVASGSGLVLTVSGDGEAQVWNPANGSPLATLGRSGNVYNPIYAASFTPDGKHILFVNQIEAYVEDVTNGRKISFAPGQGQRFINMELSSDGTTAIGAEWSGKQPYTTQVIAFNCSDGREVNRATIPDFYTILAGTASGAKAVVTGGQSIAVKNPARNVLIVDMQSGKTVAAIPVAQFDMAQVSPRGDLILMNHSPGTQPPEIYSAQTGAKVATLSANGATATSASWSPSGRYVISENVASGAANGAVWDASTWKPIHVWPNAVWSATAMNPAESLLASLTNPGQISIWDVRSGVPVKQFDDAICAGSLLGAPSTQFSHVAFSTDGTRLIDAGGGPCATIWNWQQIPSAEPVLRSNGAVMNSIAFSPDGSRAVTGGNDGNAIIWNAATGTATLTLNNKDTASTPAGLVALFTPDAKEVVTGGSFQDPALWNASNGSLLGRLSFDKHEVVINDTIRVGVGRSGNHAVTFSSDGWGALWDLANRKQLASLHTEGGANVRSLAFSPDGSEFVVADASGFAFVFDALRGTLMRKVGTQGTPLITAEISPKKEKTLTADSSGHIAIWNLADGRALLNINTAAGAPAVNDIHFSPDGTKIAAACADNKVRTWNAETGQPELTVAEETVPGEMPALATANFQFGAAVQAGMLRVQYSPDGAFIAGTNEAGHIMIWEAASGKQLLRFEGHTGRVTSLAFSPDGTRIGSSSQDGTARIWDVSLENRTPAEIKQELAAIH